MPKHDLAFAIRSIETSSISLHRQMANPKSREAAKAKLQEALTNHQRTLGRLMRCRPLQEVALALAIGGELGRMRRVAATPDFEPNSKIWLKAASRWQALQRQTLSDLERLAQKNADVDAEKKAFGLALLASVMALFLNEHSPRLSALVAEDRYKTALSKLTMEQMV